MGQPRGLWSYTKDSKGGRVDAAEIVVWEKKCRKRRGEGSFGPSDKAKSKTHASLGNGKKLVKQRHHQREKREIRGVSEVFLKKLDKVDEDR